MESFIIDTNFFINLQRPTGLGTSKEEVVQKFVGMYRHLTTQGNVRFLSTPEAFRETIEFFDNPADAGKLLQQVITIQSPSLTTITLHATLFHELVAEMNKRLYKGMRVTEEMIRTVCADTLTDTSVLEETYIKQLRTQYRAATREGFLDSTIDLGLMLLARETSGYIVSSDKGLLSWARRFGCKELYPEHMMSKLEPFVLKAKKP